MSLILLHGTILPPSEPDLPILTPSSPSLNPITLRLHLSPLLHCSEQLLLAPECAFLLFIGASKIVEAFPLVFHLLHSLDILYGKFVIAALAQDRVSSCP